MTMDVEADQSEGELAEKIDRDQIMDYLSNKQEIFFKSQQRGENDLTKQEKTNIALEIFNKSKLHFLIRFGKYLQQSQLDFFHQFIQNDNEADEINILLREFSNAVKKNEQINIKNRRYEALKEMIQENSYFSEVEMMKRNPLLYEQLVGQYLTKEEKMARDKININESQTLVKILMEGIERDDAKLKKAEQEEYEDGMMEEEEEDDEKEENKRDEEMCSDEDFGLEPTCSRWGEFEETKSKQKPKRKPKSKEITAQEQTLLREEFISSMYQHFLDGKDEDFDYESVDNNDKYDNTEVKEYDEEDKYFDSEEPEIIATELNAEESEDELDIYMSALNQNPAVSQLSKDIQNL